MARKLLSFSKRCCHCGWLYSPRQYRNCPECHEDVPYWLRGEKEITKEEG